MVEPCACGGYVTVLEGWTNERAVIAHNLTAVHRQWRRWRELNDRLDRAQRASLNAALLAELGLTPAVVEKERRGPA